MASSDVNDLIIHCLEPWEKRLRVDGLKWQWWLSSVSELKAEAAKILGEDKRKLVMTDMDGQVQIENQYLPPHTREVMLRKKQELSKREQEEQQYKFLKNRSNIVSCIKADDQVNLNLFVKFLNFENDNEFAQTLQNVMGELKCMEPNGIGSVISIEVGRKFMLDLFDVEVKRASDIVLEEICHHMATKSTNACFELFWSPPNERARSGRAFSKPIESQRDEKVRALINWLTAKQDTFLESDAPSKYLKFWSHCLQNNTVRRYAKRHPVARWEDCRLPVIIFGEDCFSEEWGTSYGAHLFEVLSEHFSLKLDAITWHLESVPGLTDHLMENNANWVMNIITTVESRNTRHAPLCQLLLSDPHRVNLQAWFTVVDRVYLSVSDGQIVHILCGVKQYFDELLSRGSVMESPSTGRMEISLIAKWLRQPDFGRVAKGNGLVVVDESRMEDLLGLDDGWDLVVSLITSHLSMERIFSLVNAHETLFSMLWMKTTTWQDMLKEESKNKGASCTRVAEFVLTFDRLCHIISATDLSRLRLLIQTLSEPQLKILSKQLCEVTSHIFWSESRVGLDSGFVNKVSMVMQISQVARTVRKFPHAWNWSAFAVTKEEYSQGFSNAKRSLLNAVVAELMPIHDAVDLVGRLWDVVEDSDVILSVIEREARQRGAGGFSMAVFAPKVLKSQRGPSFVNSVIGKSNADQVRLMMQWAWRLFSSMLNYSGTTTTLLENVVACIRNPKTVSAGREIFFECRALDERMVTNPQFGSYLSALAFSYAGRGLESAAVDQFWNVVLRQDVMRLLARERPEELFDIVSCASTYRLQTTIRMLSKWRDQGEFGYAEFWVEFDRRFGFMLLADGIGKFVSQETKSADIVVDNDDQPLHFLEVPMNEWTTQHFIQWAQSVSWPKKLQGPVNEVIELYEVEIERCIGTDLDEENITSWEHYEAFNKSSMLRKRFLIELKKVRGQLPTQRLFSPTSSDIRVIEEVKEEESSWSLMNLLPTWKSRSTATSTSMVAYNDTVGKPLGLRNLGSTCFMNSGLQCAFQIPWLVEYLMQYDGSLRQGVDKELFDAFVQLAKEARHVARPSGTRSISTYHDALARVNSLYRSFRQLDAFESVQVLITSLHKTLNAAKQPAAPVVEPHHFQCKLEGATLRDLNLLNDLVSRQFIEFERAVENRDHSVVTELVQGVSVLFEHCLNESCNATVFSFEKWNFVDVLLEYLDGSDSFSDVIGAVNRTREVSWLCPECRGKDAVEFRTFYRVPRVLFLRVCRFSTDASDSTRKLSSVVEYTNDVKLRLFGGKELEYELSSVCLHHGGSVMGGHYVADVKNDVDGKWYRANDSFVNERQSFSRPNGDEVMLIYKLR